MLSDAQIRAAKPKDRSYKLFDAHQLFLLVTTGGSKLWRLNYKYDGKQKSLARGRYPLLGLAEARRLRDEALAKLTLAAITLFLSLQRAWKFYRRSLR